VSAWVYTGLRALGFSLGGIAWLAVPLAGLWAWLAYTLGKRQGVIAASAQAKPSSEASPQTNKSY